MRHRAPIFTLVLLLAVLAAPAALPGGNAPVGTATAATCGIDEYKNDSDAYGTPNALITTDGLWFQTEDAKWDCEDLTDDLSYYQGASSMRASYQGFTTVYDNSLADSALGAYSELEKEVLWSYDNDTSLTTAKINSQAAVDDFYTIKERNYLENWRAIAAAANTWENQSGYTMFTTGGSPNGIYVEYENGNEATDVNLDSYSTSFAGTGSRSVTLVNGSTVTVPTLKYEVSVTWRYDSNTYSPWSDTEIKEVGPYTTDVNWTVYHHDSNSGYDFNFYYSPSDLTLNAPPDTSFSDKMWILFSRVGDRLSTLQTEWNNFDASNEDYTEGIYNGLDTGQITYSDAISRATQIDTYLQQATSENATFNMAVVGLYGAGLDSVAVGNTSYMNVTMQTDQYDMTITREGMLLSRGAPAGGWEYGVNYSSGNITGGQMFLSMDGDEYTINGTFTINGAYDSAGDPINSSDISNPDTDELDTFNATQYVEFMEDVRQDLNDIEDTLNDGSGTGGSSSSSASNPLAWLLNQLGISARELAMFVGAFVAGALLLSIVLSSITPG